MSAVATRCVAETLLAALPLAVLLWLCGEVAPLAAFAAMAASALVVLCVGTAALRALGALDASPMAAWVLGVFATSLALFGLVAWLDLRATTAALAVAVAASGLAWRYRASQRTDVRDLSALALCGAATLLWCHHSAAAPAILARTNVLPLWVDYVVHGGIISGFGDPLAQGAQSVELAGFPRPFYHHASYLLPAILAGPLDLPGLPLAAAAWLPLGVFTLFAGAYVFGQTLAGHSGGAAAVAALALVPDAGDYGLANAFFGFKWHVLTHPSAAYAIGIAFVSFALLRRWTEERRPWLLAASVALAAGVLLFRAHIFVLALPCVLASAALATPAVRRRWPAWLAAAFMLLAGAFFMVGEKRALLPFLDTVHHQPSIAYAGWYDALLRHGAALAVPLGVLLVFPAFLGLFTLLYPLALWIRRGAALDALPLVLLGGYAALMLVAPIPANGDSTELTQRPFALVYAVVAAWSAAMLAGRLSYRSLMGACAAALVLLWPQSGLWSEFPKFSWGWNYYAHPIEPGLGEAARFVRREGKPGDVFAVHGLQRGWAPIERPGWVPVDPAVELAALSGMPAYIARPYLPILEGGERRLVAEERLEALQAIERETRRDIALGRLAAYGVQWYVATSNQAPRWDPKHQRAAFRHGEVAVYRTTSR